MTASYEFVGELPSNQDAERTILGAILLDNNAYDTAAESLIAEDFTGQHPVLYRTISQMIAAGRTADIVTISEELASSKKVELVGGVAYIASLTEGMPRSLAIDEYVAIVRDKSMLRRIITAGSNAVIRACDQSEPPQSIIDSVDQELLSISSNNQSQWPDLAKQSLAEMEVLNAQRERRVERAYCFGLTGVDNLIGGLVKKEMTVVGGRPGQGKSSLLTKPAILHCRRGVPVHIFSVEMSSGKCLRRIWSAVSGVPFSRVRWPEKLSEEEYRRVVEAMAEVSNWPLIIDDSSSLTIDQLLSRARISKRRYNTEIVMVDYLQKLNFKSEGKYRYLEVADAAVKLARLAKSEDMALLVLSSITERSEKNRNEPPTLADLRQSGDIQFEASNVLLLHREVDAETEKLCDEGVVIVAKARDDRQGVVPVLFNHTSLQFEDKQYGGGFYGESE
jgi:replicative DNA helicase